MYLCNIKYYCPQFFNIESPKKHFTFFILNVWRFNKFFITVFYTVIFTFWTLIFIVLVALIYNMYMKLLCVIKILIRFMFSIRMNFFRIAFRIFCFMFGCLLLLTMVSLLCWCFFVNVLQVSYLCFTSFNDCNLSSSSSSSSSCSVFVHSHIIIDKDGDCLQSNNNSSSNFMVSFFNLSTILEDLIRLVTNPNFLYF